MAGAASLPAARRGVFFDFVVFDLLDVTADGRDAADRFAAPAPGRFARPEARGHFRMDHLPAGGQHGTAR
jgi:hypothetical protein